MYGILEPLNWGSFRIFMYRMNCEEMVINDSILDSDRGFMLYLVTKMWSSQLLF